MQKATYLEIKLVCAGTAELVRGCRATARGRARGGRVVQAEGSPRKWLGENSLMWMSPLCASPTVLPEPPQILLQLLKPASARRWAAEVWMRESGVNLSPQPPSPRTRVLAAGRREGWMDGRGDALFCFYVEKSSEPRRGPGSRGAGRALLETSVCCSRRAGREEQGAQPGRNSSPHKSAAVTLALALLPSPYGAFCTYAGALRALKRSCLQS